MMLCNSTTKTLTESVTYSIADLRSLLKTVAGPAILDHQITTEALESQPSEASDHEDHSSVAVRVSFCKNRVGIPHTEASVPVRTVDQFLDETR
jgi:hypothetical protein